MKSNTVCKSIKSMRYLGVSFREGAQDPCTESCSALQTHLAGPVGHTPGLRRCHAVQTPAPRTDRSLTQSLPELQQPRLSRLASALKCTWKCRAQKETNGFEKQRLESKCRLVYRWTLNWPQSGEWRGPEGQRTGGRTTQSDRGLPPGLEQAVHVDEPPLRKPHDVRTGRATALEGSSPQ